MVHRDIIDSIIQDFGRGKVIVVLGPRQTGKTTLLDQLTEGQTDVYRLNCDDYDDALDFADDWEDEFDDWEEAYEYWEDSH